MPATPQPQEPLKQGKYNDIPLFLILIPLINALNYYLTYSTISLSWHTLVTYLIDTFTGYAAWLGIRFTILLLDKRLPYEPKPLKRILVQTALTTIAGLIIIIAETEIVNSFATNEPVPTSFYLFDIFIFAIWCLVVNGIYIGFHFYYEWKQAELLRKKDKEIRRDGFIVDQGKQSLSIPFTDIFSLSVEGEYVVLLTTTAKKYYISLSLDSCEQLLPEEWFFRLNRQFIVHRNAIKGFSRVENGKLSVFVFPGTIVPDAILVSRTKAANFKSWFAPA
jgi:hypothetical protein